MIMSTRSCTHMGQCVAHDTKSRGVVHASITHIHKHMHANAHMAMTKNIIPKHATDMRSENCTVHRNSPPETTHQMLKKYAQPFKEHDTPAKVCVLPCIRTSAAGNGGAMLSDGLCFKVNVCILCMSLYISVWVSFHVCILCFVWVLVCVCDCL